MSASIEFTDYSLAFMCFPGPNKTPIFRYCSLG